MDPNFYYYLIIVEICLVNNYFFKDKPILCNFHKCFLKLISIDYISLVFG